MDNITKQIIEFTQKLVATIQKLQSLYTASEVLDQKISLVASGHGSVGNVISKIDIPIINQTVRQLPLKPLIFKHKMVK